MLDPIQRPDSTGGGPTMTLLLLFFDKTVAAIQVLLDEGVVDLGDALFELPFDIGGIHRRIRPGIKLCEIGRWWQDDRRKKYG